MEATILVLITTAVGATGFAVGTLCAEWRSRREALSKIDKTVDTWTLALTNFTKVHNELAEKVLDIDGRVSVHELKLSGVGK